jgi:AraC-like DNA-binding protein
MADLTRGGSVTAVAYACGYASVSAFVTAFRTELGTTPAEWARADRSLDADPAAAANLSDPDGGLR